MNYKFIILLIFSFFLLIPSVLTAQSKYGTTEEEIRTCQGTISLYREFFKINMFIESYDFWQKADSICPLAADNHYPYGRRIILNLLEQKVNKKRRKELKNRLLKIYDDWLKVSDNPAEIKELKTFDFKKINNRRSS